MEPTDTPDIEINKAETVEIGAVESFETERVDFVPTPLTELVRKLQSATEQVLSAQENALPGDRAVLVGLAYQIDAIAELFVTSAEAAAQAAAEAQPEDDSYGIVEED